jgi:hypothetical protein
VKINLDVESMMSFYSANSKLLGDDVVWLRYRKDGFMLVFGDKTAEEAMRIIENKLPKESIPEDIMAYNTDESTYATYLYEALVNT